MGTSKLIGWAISILALFAPHIGINIDQTAQTGLTALGMAIVGIVTNGFGGTAAALFTTLLGCVPGLTWVFLTIFHLQFTPGIWNIGITIICIVIAKLDKLSDLPSFVNTALGKILGTAILLILILPMSLSACCSTGNLRYAEKGYEEIIHRDSMICEDLIAKKLSTEDARVLLQAQNISVKSLHLSVE